jgi:hypothetical protein
MTAKPKTDASIRRRLAQQLQSRGYELLEAPDIGASACTIDVSAGRLHAFHMAGHGLLNVLMPVALRLGLRADGEVTDVTGGEPSADDLRDARTSLEDIIANGRLDDPACPDRPKGATHIIVTQADGQRVVRRNGFDASTLN